MLNYTNIRVIYNSDINVVIILLYKMLHLCLNIFLVYNLKCFNYSHIIYIQMYIVTQLNNN